ncbi:hypothetical protein KUTeg_000850 [Tegillarca granosa]|uniref:Fork-head domain-containing protein n=1 Tax=Tegillarca granosa TaxID=220873 RepID=A0ABQ9FYU5_TEGGR|nr:hypothetical protein KUTeg_000850 [Tegillarca granosa]
MVKRKFNELSSGHEVWIEPKPKMAATNTHGDFWTINSSQMASDAEKELRAIMDDFVQVYERLDIGDNTDSKPNYSYTELVFLAILRSTNFCLPITEIYKYIQSRFVFFRNSTRGHWKNAVRHSLSKTKCFTKISVGRGIGPTGVLNRSTFLWCIIPKSIISFARGDYRPNVDKESGLNTLRLGYYRVNAGQFWDQVALSLEQKMYNFKHFIASHPRPGHVFEMQKCVTAEKPEQAVDQEPTRAIGHSSDVFEKDRMVKIEDAASPEGYKNTAVVNDISPVSSGDSGNETLSDSSPEDERYRYINYRFERPNLNSSYLSSGRVSPNEIDVNRKTPENLDFGQLSPLELSPIPNPYQDETPVYYPASIPAIPTIPVSSGYLPPTYGYYDNTRYYNHYQTVPDWNLVYPPVYYPDIAATYPGSYPSMPGSDPMFPTTNDWNLV